MDFEVSLDVPPPSETTATTVFLSYDNTKLHLPGSGFAANTRVAVAGGVTRFANDVNFAVNVVLSSSQEILNPIMTINFDLCTGETADLTNVGCTVRACAGVGGEIESCTCTAAIP